MSRTRIALAVALVAAALAGCKPPASQDAPAASAASAADAPSAQWPFISAPGPLAQTADLTRRNYYVVFDASGSMLDHSCAGANNRLTVAKRALAQFASRLPADANLGLLVFGEGGVHERIALAPINQEVIQREVESISAGGGTPLAETAERAYEALTVQGRKQLGYGEYHLVIVTDGVATGADPRVVINRIVSQSPVVVHTIGFCLNDKHALNQPGRTLYKPADNPAALAQNMVDVLAEAPSFDVKQFEAPK